MPDALDFLRREIEGIIVRHFEVERGYETVVPGLQVGRITELVPPTAHMAEASVCVCISGVREITYGETVYRHDPSRFLLHTVALPTIVSVDASPDRPYTALQIDIDLDLARQVMADIDMQGMEVAQPANCLSFGRMDQALLDAIARLTRLMDRPGDVPFMSGLIHREILYRLLSGPSGYKLRRIVRFDSQGHRASKAVAWLRGHFREKLRIEDLADVAGMGVSTLHRHFLELTGMSPIQYQKHLRLHEARRQMLEGEGDVGSTALSVGYESSTQFIREYRRLFGEPPVRDIKAIRARGRRQQVL